MRGRRKREGGGRREGGRKRGGGEERRQLPPPGKYRWGKEQEADVTCGVGGVQGATAGVQVNLGQKSYRRHKIVLLLQLILMEKGTFGKQKNRGSHCRCTRKWLKFNFSLVFPMFGAALFISIMLWYCTIH